MQLPLFHGPHIPLTRLHAAIERGDLRVAREAFVSTYAAEGEAHAERLSILERLLLRSADASPEEVHAVFVETLEAKPRMARDPIPPSHWFRLYAAHMARALVPATERSFRGWCGLHFELAAGRPRAALDAASGLVAGAPSPWSWLEAARAAYASGESALGRRWILLACLSSREALLPDPPGLAPVDAEPLDAPAFALPELPRAIVELWRDASDLELPSPASGWVPVIGLIDGHFALSDLHAPEIARARGLDDEAVGPEEPTSRAFLRALVAAREARAAEPPAGRECGAVELRARAAMKRIAPVLFERFMGRLGLGL
jgi:hypothetical protein